MDLNEEKINDLKMVFPSSKNCGIKSWQLKSGLQFLP